MRLKFLICVAASFGLSGSGLAASPVEGYWLTENERAIIRIDPCDTTPEASICGRIVWLSEPLNDAGQVKTDRKNPDPAQRANALCAVKLIWAFKSNGDGKWNGGSIYNPRDGQTYAASMTVDGDRLLLRGYVLAPLFGSTQAWTRVPDDRGGC